MRAFSAEVSTTDSRKIKLFALFATMGFVIALVFAQTFAYGADPKPQALKDQYSVTVKDVVKRVGDTVQRQEVVDAVSTTATGKSPVVKAMVNSYLKRFPFTIEKPGHYTFPVQVTYADKSIKQVNVKVRTPLYFGQIKEVDESGNSLSFLTPMTEGKYRASEVTKVLDEQLEKLTGYAFVKLETIENSDTKNVTYRYLVKEVPAKPAPSAEPTKEVDPKPAPSADPKPEVTAPVYFGQIKEVDESGKSVAFLFNMEDGKASGSEVTKVLDNELDKLNSQGYEYVDYEVVTSEDGKNITYRYLVKKVPAKPAPSADPTKEVDPKPVPSVEPTKEVDPKPVPSGDPTKKADPKPQAKLATPQPKAQLPFTGASVGISVLSALVLAVAGMVALGLRRKGDLA